jgi:putative DNA primase/helicase
MIHNRQADNWRPLLAIADMAGGPWPDRARAAAIRLTDDGADDTESIRVRLLADIAEIFNTVVGDRLPSKQIVERLVQMEDRPWPEFRKSKAITTRQLSSLLAPFGIRPNSIRIAEGTPKGYRLDQFTDAFARYCPNPPFRSATPPQVKQSVGYSDSQSATSPPHVADEKTPKPAEYNGCGGVADRNPGSGTETPFEPDSADAEEREAVMAIDGEQACVQCGDPVDPTIETIPVAGGGVLHMECYEQWMTTI